MISFLLKIETFHLIVLQNPVFFIAQYQIITAVFFLNSETLKKKPPKYIEIETNDLQSIANFSEAMSRSNLISKLNRDMFSDPNSTYEIIEAEINRLKSQFLPTKKVRFNKYKHKKSPWITYGILSSLKTRDDTFQKWKTSIPDSIRYNIFEVEYREYASVIDRLICKSKYDYYSQNVSRGLQKALER